MPMLRVFSSFIIEAQAFVLGHRRFSGKTAGLNYTARLLATGRTQPRTASGAGDARDTTESRKYQKSVDQRDILILMS
jgi:hypothetical protein